MTTITRYSIKSLLSSLHRRKKKMSMRRFSQIWVHQSNLMWLSRSLPLKHKKLHLSVKWTRAQPKRVKSLAAVVVVVHQVAHSRHLPPWAQAVMESSVKLARKWIAKCPSMSRNDSVRSTSWRKCDKWKNSLRKRRSMSKNYRSHKRPSMLRLDNNRELLRNDANRSVMKS